MPVNPQDIVDLIAALPEPPKKMTVTVTLAHPICEVFLDFEYRCEPEQFAAGLEAIGFEVFHDFQKARIEFGDSNPQEVEILGELLRESFEDLQLIAELIVIDKLLETKDLIIPNFP